METEVVPTPRTIIVVPVAVGMIRPSILVTIRQLAPRHMPTRIFVDTAVLGYVSRRTMLTQRGGVSDTNASRVRTEQRAGNEQRSAQSINRYPSVHQ
jgi:hypothetical protein